MKIKTALRCFSLIMAMSCALPVAASAQETAHRVVTSGGAAAVAPSATRRFEFGTVDQKDTIVTLEITSRLDAKTALGSSYFLKMALNGHEIDAARSRSAQRLVNKPLTSPVTSSVSALWYGGAKGWRALYAPDFEVARKFAYYQGDPYTLVLDITDLINPAADNRLDITNTAEATAIGASGTSGNLVIDSITVRTRPGASPLLAPVKAAEVYLNRGEPAAGPMPYKSEILPGGAFALTLGAKRWAIETAISYPNGGFNHLSPTKNAADRPDWRNSLRTKRNDLTAQTDKYKLDRKINFGAELIEVEDSFTNLTDAPLGLRVRHQTSLQGLPNATVYIAGNPDPGVSDYYSPGNPSVVVQASDHLLGFLCEDDVFRGQARLFTETPPGSGNAVAGIRTDMLRLAPQETYVLKWSVAPVKGRDYFDFINLVRRHWKANHTALGAWLWGFYPDTILAMTDVELRSKFERLGIRYVASGGGWVDFSKDRKIIGFGNGVFAPYWDDMRRRMREASAKIHKAMPGVKVLAYYDAQRDTSADSPQKYKDSWLTDPDGSQRYTDWSNAYQRTFSTVPTTENAFGRDMVQAAGRYMDEVGLDGIYWDEMENTAFGAPLLTYNLKDGHSCEIDPVTNTIKRELGLTILVSQAFRLQVVREVQKRGGILLGNGPTTSRALLDTGIQRMVESQHNDNFPAEGLLQTPLGYMSRQVKFPEFQRMIRLGLLPVGTSLDYTHDFVRYLFPFTPVELHSGYLLGKERIVVAHSGNYGWRGEKNIVLLHFFDKEGNRLAKTWPTVIKDTARTAVELAEGEAAVLEKLPVSIDPGAGEARVEGVTYESGKVTFQLKAPAGAVVTLKNGVFAVTDGAKYQVERGGRQSVVVAKGDALRISIGKGFSGEVSIVPVP